MDVTIIPSKLRGTVTPPSSKSVGHRALIAAALSGGGLQGHPGDPAVSLKSEHLD